MLDFRPVTLTVGYLLLLLSAAMVFPALIDLDANNPDWLTFAISAITTAIVGGMTILGSRTKAGVTINKRQAFLLTAASWLIMATFAALPFLFAGKLDYTDAFFEAMSGLTTTGSTVLSGLDDMPPGLLIWRSLIQWIGGIGIVLMAILVLPYLRVGGMHLFQTESSEQSSGAVRVRHLAYWLGLVYVGLTVACALLYGLGGMTLFDAVNHAMTTLSTGGYSTHDASLGFYPQTAIHVTGTVFMAAAALPFVLYIRAVRGDWRPLWRDPQVRGVLGLLSVATLILTAWLWLQDGRPLATALIDAAFNATSILTTTGYASENYAAWGTLPVGMFFLLTFFGGTTGSTSGALKTFRIQVLLIMAYEQTSRLLFPHGVFRRRYGDLTIGDDIVASVLAFMAAYLAAVALLTFGLSAFGLDLVTSLTGAATAVANVGPGLGSIIGPAGNFSSLPDGAKWLLSLGMLLGRLELFTVLVLFLPSFWKS